MYDVEHEELFDSIRAGKPINNGKYMVGSTMLALLGAVRLPHGPGDHLGGGLNSTVLSRAAALRVGRRAADQAQRQGRVRHPDPGHDQVRLMDADEAKSVQRATGDACGRPLGCAEAVLQLPAAVVACLAENMQHSRPRLCRTATQPGAAVPHEDDKAMLPSWDAVVAGQGVFSRTRTSHQPPPTAHYFSSPAWIHASLTATCFMLLPSLAGPPSTGFCWTK